MVSSVFRILMVTTILSLPFAADAATLADSITQAVAHHPKIEAGKASRDSAGNTLREQRSALFPMIGVQGRAGRVRADDDTTRAATGGNATSWLGEGSVTVTQPLFTGFSTTHRIEAAQERMRAAEQDLGGSAEDVALMAARAHLFLMRTRELLDLSRQYLSDIQGRRDNIEKMVKGGATGEAELLQAEEILMVARTTRLDFEDAYRQAEANYIEMVGAVPEETLQSGEIPWDKLLPETADNALKLAVASNPKLLSADRVVLALGEEAEAERGTLMPKVDAEMSYLQKDQHEELGGELSNAQAMLKMSWNFSTGGGQMARVDRGLSQQAEARARRDDTLRTIESSVRQKFAAMQVMEEQFGLYADREGMNEKIVQHFLSQFEGGKQSNLQLLSAQARLFDAKSARIDAYYRRLLARFELLNAMGRLRKAFVVSPAAVTSKK